MGHDSIAPMTTMERNMRLFKLIVYAILPSWLLVVAIDGFWGGITFGRVGAIISLVGAAIGFILIGVPCCRRPSGDES